MNTQPMDRRLQPLTERILARLPGRPEAWILVWACVPWANAGANLLLGTPGRIWEESRVLGALNYTAVTFAVVITLWGSGRIARRLELLGATTERFRELNNVVVPLAGSVATSIAFAAAAFVRDGWAAALLRGATWFILGTAFCTFLWTYASLQLGLHRLGRDRLPRASAVDPTLGLRPLGAVAFMGLWMLLVWLVPVAWTGLPDLVGLAIGLLILTAGLAVFFLSLFRLHRQMVEVKASELAIARELYAQAYEPVRAAPTLEALDTQRGLLSAAEALEKRADAIREWPVDEGTLARVLTIATSIVAGTLTRLILEPIGL